MRGWVQMLRHTGPISTGQTINPTCEQKNLRKYSGLAAKGGPRRLRKSNRGTSPPWPRGGNPGNFGNPGNPHRQRGG
jgi:hypothetical protein